MSTVGSLIDRIYREVLARPDGEPSQTTLATVINDSVTSFDLDAFSIPEEIALLGPGVIIEVGLELMRVTGLSGSTVTVTRGVRGTTATAHSIGDTVYLAPSFARKTVFDAVADAVVGLYPDLFRVRTANVDPLSLSEINDPLAVSIVSVRYLTPIGWHETQARFVFGLEEEVSEQSLALELPIECWGNETYVTYRAKFARPANESVDLFALGVEEEWLRLIIVDTASYLVALLGPSAIRAEFVTDTLEETGRQPNEEQSLAVALIRLRQTYLTRHKRAIEKQHRPMTRVRPSF